ncbi:hypothetical protein [Lysinibacillus sp. 54212]|uniref:hypothetical protein n=1 Tax=Lysinibacillus sp. 54212 TaxID=3119829 RepID=UPI002FC9F246
MALNKTSRKNYRFDGVTGKLLEVMKEKKLFPDETKLVQEAIFRLATEKLGAEKVREIKREVVSEQLEKEMEE